jgi:hypothetical protein
MNYIINGDTAYFTAHETTDAMIKYLQGDSLEYLKSEGVIYVSHGIRKIQLDEISDNRNELVLEELVDDFADLLS